MLVDRVQNSPTLVPVIHRRTVEATCPDRDPAHDQPRNDHPERVTLFTVGPKPFWAFLETQNILRANLDRARDGRDSFDRASNSTNNATPTTRSPRTADDAPAVRAAAAKAGLTADRIRAAYDATRPQGARTGSLVDQVI